MPPVPVNPLYRLPDGYTWGDIWTDEKNGECGRFIIRTHDGIQIRAIDDLFAGQDYDISFDEIFSRAAHETQIEINWQLGG